MFRTTIFYMSLSNVDIATYLFSIVHTRKSETMPNFLESTHLAPWLALWWASWAVRGIKNPSARQETQEIWVWSLGWEKSLEESMATHSSILARRIPWTEEPGGLLSIGLHRVGHHWNSWAHTHTGSVEILNEWRQDLVLPQIPNCISPSELSFSTSVQVSSSRFYSPWGLEFCIYLIFHCLRLLYISDVCGKLHNDLLRKRLRCSS